MIEAPCSESAQRNTGPILEVLRAELGTAKEVLEIGSGTGQHAVHFASELPGLRWQTSDRTENHGGIAAWLEQAQLDNLLPPLSLDVLKDTVTADAYDVVYSSNTAHIMSMAAVEKMFAIAGRALVADGVFCLYGPFRQGGEFNARSNAEFHQNLRARSADMGIRHLESLDTLARNNGLQYRRLYAMPANNYLVVWRKEFL